MDFRRLRLTGFKSFVEPTDLVIESGLTGIVGPNGCGKSNLIEALRWAMGEASAKQLRGSEMDDVIFNGTASRPPRHVADVAVLLGNDARTAPAAFNALAEIEVSRRITRGDGSTYRVNGREVRARDVQLLFADAATGARSTAIVSQGQIGAFINAKPAQRRAVIEEAAGITGLHQRRHEAELRLKAAEANLERLEDIAGTLDGQLAALRRQARQATRYRRLSDDIRRAEATALRARWLEGEAAATAARAALEAAERTVGEAARHAAAAVAEAALADAGLPPLRQAEAREAAALARLAAERDVLAAEQRRAGDDRLAADGRLAMLVRDLAREVARMGEAEAALARLAEEQSVLAEAETDGAALAQATDAATAAQAAMAEREVAVGDATAALARDEAEAAARGREAAALAERLGRAGRQRDQARRELDAAVAAAVPADVVSRARAEAEAGETALATALAEADRATHALARAREAEVRAGETLQAAESALAALRAERKALQAVLRPELSGSWPPLLDVMQVAPGYEAALAAALGDDLQASLDPAAPRRWELAARQGDAPPLPDGAEAMAAHVSAPEALASRLAQIGVAPDATDIDAMSARLRPGQRLVTRNGELWRWDGYRAAPGARAAVTERLVQRNRLAALDEALPAAEAVAAAARERAETARRAAAGAGEAERQARDALRRAEAGLRQSAQALSTLEARSALQDQKLATAREVEARHAADLDALRRQHAAAQAAVVDAAALDDARAALAVLRADLTRARQALGTAEAERERLRRDAELRRRRLLAIGEERAACQARIADSTGQMETLEARHATEATLVETLAARLPEIEARLDGMAEALDTAQRRRGTAADSLAAAEARRAACDRAQREGEHALAVAREERVRREAAAQHAAAAQESLAQRIRDRLDSRPESLAALAALDAAEPAGDPAALERRLEQLMRERDGMGPVNLRAEQEAEALEQEIAGMRGAREDLLAAIAKLRRGIAELDREGRQRLLAAFEQVDRHFRSLFMRLFGGGKAQLALIDSDDPLEAGLEIVAAPPGKRPQPLSLLSGGERALTALALLFAVFLTNPAPICVLDEVDAPLDDANVDRFCTLLAEITASAATRFLLVTHHRMTMARMDRLYGVTMAERGVSQLVSVDLHMAEELRQSA